MATPHIPQDLAPVPLPIPAASKTQSTALAPVLPFPAVGALLIPADTPLPPAKRLVVLVPDSDVDEAELASRILSLAAPRWLQVLFVGAGPGPEAELLARRRLSLLAAMTRDDRTSVETRLEPDGDWLRAVHRVWRPGDLIVCHAEQVLSGLSGRPKSLANAIVSALNTPVYVLSGFYPRQASEWSPRLARFLSWLPPLAILVVFFMLQVRIAQGTTGWVQTALLCLSVVVECGLIGACERFFLAKNHA